MATLVIDTATEACSVALLQDGMVIAEDHALVGRGHAERLIPMIQTLLAAAKTTRADKVLVDCGPGSFTGIRVGLAAARALGFAWQVPVRGYSSMAVLAAAQTMTGSIAIAITGGHGEVFVQRFEPSALVPSTELASLTPAAAGQIIVEEQVVGSGAQAVIAARGRGEAIDALPRAADARLLPDVLADLPPTPLYGRAPDAKPSAL